MPAGGRSFLCMSRSAAIDAARTAGYISVTDRLTAPPWGARGTGEPRVVGFRETERLSIELIIAYEDYGLNESRKPPR